MQGTSGAIQLSASDLVGHLNCRYLTQLDLSVLKGGRAKPDSWDPLLQILVERGARHEHGFLEHLKTTGLTISVVDGAGVDAIAVARTTALMKEGAPIIAQGALSSNGWVGRADILRRIEVPSALGTWSYEVIDTKLARETKGNTVLQLSLYSDLVRAMQGAAPEFAYVVTPWSNYTPQPYRVLDYSAYYRRVRKSLETAVSAEPDRSLYPDPKPHCEVCRWRNHCDEKRHADDHLSLVAGIGKIHINELKRHQIETMAGLVAASLPLPWKPDRGAAQTYARMREQARVQVQGRAEARMIFETLPIAAGFGLCRLPEPTPGDIFLDLEGNPFAGEGGVEFLFGYCFNEDGERRYTAHWALNRAQERAGFEAFMDFATSRLKQYPDLHIYHFAPYEPAAFKRLMGRYATREEDLDSMLRTGVFVDLYSVVRHGIRASVESYSIKKLEPLYGYARSIALHDANSALTKVQASIELGLMDGITDHDRAVVEGYNKDDCVSTWSLRDWLEERRAGMIAAGHGIGRPEPQSGEAREELNEWQQKVAAMVAQLTVGVPADPAERSAEEHARWLLAYLVDFHRREDKAVWWEYFRLADLSAEDLLEEKSALSGLIFVGVMGGTAKYPVHRYSFPAQETEFRGGEELRSQGGAKFGSVEQISLEDRWIDIKKRKDTAEVHAEAVFKHRLVPTTVLADSLMRIAEYVATHGISGEGRYRAARDLLLRVAPRLNEPIRQEGEAAVTAAIRAALALRDSVLPIQGPPGAGKTHTGARMICSLAKAGRKIGVTANSHKVIRNLLDETLVASSEGSSPIRCIQAVREEDVEDDLPSLRFTANKKGELFAALRADDQVAGGTAWLWAQPAAAECVDVLFIDEAAQMSLAKVVAASQAAKSIVLLGDPRQLEEPLQGSHPEGTDVSALTHILNGQATIQPDRGLFLDETWRLHPELCAFTSEIFYENRLRPRTGLERQIVKASGRVPQARLLFLPVRHEGNQSSSPEEAETIETLVREILCANPTWINREEVERLVTLNDILIIAPYNAQVFELQDRINGGRIGTVDKFQGQEAPIVIYSMTTSTHADAPRGMEFVYSANRLNVATSRAKCICILVGSPALFEAECRTPRQMLLANGFCRYLEMATLI